MADTQDVQQLKRRARRRLVGAIALVLFLVIVPPMLMDLEPKPVTTDLTVEIPSQSGGQVKTPPPAPVAKAEPTADAATSPSGGSSASAATGKAAKAEKTEPAEQADKSEQPAKAAAADESKSKHASPLATATVDPRKAKEAQRVESILKGNAFVVPLGAYSNPENVKQLQSKLARAGVKSYTEPVKGASSAQTRVAAGPFATREEAEQARQKLASLKGLGVVPGVITTRQ
jgi:DedD protein